MLLRSNNVIDPHELTATWFKLLAASIAIMLTAHEAVPAELKAVEESADWMQSYGDRNKDCLEWTNTCVNCVRVNFSCSNIGIACQPKDVICLMSDIPPKADIGGDGCDVRFVPKADSCSAAMFKAHFN